MHKILKKHLFFFLINELLMNVRKTPKLIYFLVIFVPFLSSLIFPSTFVSAQSDEQNAEGFYKEQFRLEKGMIRYYVTALDKGDYWYVNLTSVYQGIFYLYVFNERPTQEYQSQDGSINHTMLSKAVASNSTPIQINSTIQPDLLVNFIELSYTASEDKMYYLLIYLAGGSAPDTFIIHSNSRVQAYFIPFIPGYPIEWIFSVSFAGIIGLKIKLKKNAKSIK
jgi:hypothetical protein